MSPPEADQLTDSDLVAYLDGELAPTDRSALEGRLAGDAVLRARLERLRAGGRPFVEAFDILLRNAPQDRLATILVHVLRQAQHASLTLSRSKGLSPRADSRRLALVAAAVFLFLLGTVAGYLLPRTIESAGEKIATQELPPDGWRQVVAEYLTLYTSDTLASIPDDPAQRAHELSTAGAKLSLALDPDKVALPDLNLKRAQVLAIDGRPLVQIAYLSELDGPIAFCIIADSGSDAPQRFERRLASNIVHWSKGGRGYMVIGRAPREKLEALAATLAQRIS